MILAKNIYKKFKEPVLKGVNLQAKAGEIIGLAGENGSGKSTLLEIITGLMPADSGSIEIEGTIGYVPQETALFDNLTVRDNLKFWASAYDAPWDNAEFDKSFLSKKVSQLSGGMKKRLSISLACLHQPNLLVMDEPSAALDIGFKGHLSQMLADIKAQGRTVIFSSHQADELLWCDRIYILREGVFVYEGDPREVESLPAILYGRAGD